MTPKNRITALFFLLCSFAGHVSARDTGSMTDKEFLTMFQELRQRGNELYATTANKYELQRIVQDMQQSVEARVSVGKLSDVSRDSLMLDVDKLWGDFYYLDGDENSASYAEAERRFSKCLSFAKQHSDYHDAQRYLFIIRMELAQLYYKLGKYQQALENMQEAYRRVGNYGTEDEAYDIQGQLAICKARVATTPEAFQDALEDIQGVMDCYSATDTESYGEALRKKAKIIMLREESGVLGSGKTVRQRVSTQLNGRQEALRCYSEYFQLKRRDALAHFLGMSSVARAQYWSRIRPFVTDCYRLEDTDPAFLYDVTLFAKGLLLQLDSAGRGHQNLNATWQMVQQRLQPDACAIEFVQYEKCGQQRMGALVLRNTGKPVFVRMAAPDSVMQFKILIKDDSMKVEQLMHSIHGPDFESRLPRNKLYQDTLGLNPYLWNSALIDAIGAANEVWFAPDGYIHQLAIEYMLPQTMAQKKCYRLTSTRRLLEVCESVTGGTALIIGGVNYLAQTLKHSEGNDSIAYNYIRGMNGLVFEYLEKSQKEAQDISEVRSNVADTILQAELATEQNFRSLCSRYPIIHISTHGYFGAAGVSQGTDLKPCVADNSLSESILAMAGIQHNIQDRQFDTSNQDGILSAKELAGLDLSQTQIVVLCCCETGLGYVTADGVYGIQRGLKNAGVKAIICTLWDINEEPSTFFMTNFHRALVAGQTIRQAFYAARAQMRDFISEDQDYTEPSYRDAFILIDALQ